MTSTYVLLVLAIVFFAVNSLMMGWLLGFVESEGGGMPLGNEDLWSAVRSGATNVLLIVGILGVMVLTSEFSSSSIITSLTVNPRRTMFMNAKALVLAVVTFLASFVGVLLAWGCAAIMMGSSVGTGNAEMPAAMPWVTLLGIPLAMALGAVMSIGFGALCRSTVGGVLCVVVLFMIVPSMLQMVQLLGEKFTCVVSSTTACRRTRSPISQVWAPTRSRTARARNCRWARRIRSSRVGVGWPDLPQPGPWWSTPQV